MEKVIEQLKSGRIGHQDFMGEDQRKMSGQLQDAQDRE